MSELVGTPSRKQAAAPTEVAPRMPEARVELQRPLIPGLAVVSLLLHFISGDRGWLLVGIGFGGLWLIAYLWAASLQEGLRVERRVDHVWAAVGDFVHEQLWLINDGRFAAIWLEVVDDSSLVEEPFNLVTEVGAQRTRIYHANHRCRRRGVLTLGPTRLRAGDPFGVYAVEIQDPQTHSVMITPPILSMEDLRIAPGGWAGDEAHRSAAAARVISDGGVRTYTPGDALRRIHWPASAHRDELLVRPLEAAASGDWWLFLDLEEAVQAGKGEDSSLELAIVAAASLAMRGLREGRRVGLVMAAPELVWLPPALGDAHRWHLLYQLARARSGRKSLVDLFELAGTELKERGTIVVITPSKETTWAAAVGARLGVASLTALLIDTVGFGEPRDRSDLRRVLARLLCPVEEVSRDLLSRAYEGRSARTRASHPQFGEVPNQTTRREPLMNPTP